VSFVRRVCGNAGHSTSSPLRKRMGDYAQDESGRMVCVRHQLRWWSAHIVFAQISE
jgi:hypothetical protein